ncbi:MAG: AI-2E family transporter [Hyphomonadaceae bacterium]
MRHAESGVISRTAIQLNNLGGGVWIIAAVAIGFVLQQGREILAPFALACFVWLVMEGFARAIRKPLPSLPPLLAHAFAILVVAGAVIGFIGVMRTAIGQFADKSALYEHRIDTLIAQVYNQFGLSDAPTLSSLVFSDAATRFVEPLLTSIQGVASNLVLILIYVGFLYVSSSTFTKKLDAVFLHDDNRERARRMGDDIRSTMEQYLWVQTALSLITTGFTYATMLALGLDNALFWAAMIFILNYIPTVGSILAAVLPALFAIAQPETSWPAYMPDDPMWCAVVVFLGVSLWQFSIGNFVGPRMMGESMNLDPLAVLLSLAVWGAIWGVPGMFLSAPLTVLLMIILAQVPGARWISVVLSADGTPPGANREAMAEADAANSGETDAAAA